MLKDAENIKNSSRTFPAKCVISPEVQTTQRADNNMLVYFSVRDIVYEYDS